MEAVYTSETSAYFSGVHGAICQNAIIFILAAVRTWNFSGKTNYNLKCLLCHRVQTCSLVNPASYPTGTGFTQCPVQRVVGSPNLLYNGYRVYPSLVSNWYWVYPASCPTGTGFSQCPVQRVAGSPNLLSNGYRIRPSSCPTGIGFAYPPVQRVRGSPSVLSNGFRVRPVSCPTGSGFAQPPVQRVRGSPSVLSDVYRGSFLWGVAAWLESDLSLPSGAQDGALPPHCPTPTEWVATHCLTPEDGTRSTFWNVVLHIGRWTESKNSIILIAVHHHQDPLQSSSCSLK
jgi:hypothetical protein